MAEPAPELALAAICRDLVRLGRRFALVGGLAVSVRAEVRFTRDVVIVVAVADDSEAESLTYELRLAGYSAVASIEHETRHRLSTVRLMTPSGVKVDLLFASSGIEAEIVDRATAIDFEGASSVPVANAEELLAMKVLSMTDTRLQDRIDAQRRRNQRSGKTTITERRLAHPWFHDCAYVNPDTIAQDELGDWNDAATVLRAAQLATERREACLREGRKSDHTRWAGKAI